MKEDFGTLAQKEMEELTKQKTELQNQIAEIEKKVKPLENYLKATGVIKASKRGRKPKESKNA